MFFGKEMDSWALDADSVVCMKEEGGPPLAPPPAPPPPLWHTALSPRRTKKGKKEPSVQADTLSTLYFLWAESKGPASLASQLRPSSFLPSFLAHFLF